MHCTTLQTSGCSKKPAHFSFCKENIRLTNEFSAISTDVLSRAFFHSLEKKKLDFFLLAFWFDFFQNVNSEDVFLTGLFT